MEKIVGDFPRNLCDFFVCLCADGHNCINGRNRDAISFRTISRASPCKVVRSFFSLFKPDQNFLIRVHFDGRTVDWIRRCEGEVPHEERDSVGIVIGRGLRGDLVFSSPFMT